MKILPLPRALGGRSLGRISPSLRLSLCKVRLLRHVASLSLEDAELDALDERSVEFLLDAQAALARGTCDVPSLSAFARVPGEPPRMGTPPRRMKWCALRRMPWRVMDYARSAERMLERQRSGGGAAMATVERTAERERASERLLKLRKA